MNIIDQIKSRLKVLMGSEAEVAFASAKLADGTEFQYEGELAEGTEVYTLDEAGEHVALADGEYTHEDGTKFMVADGKYAVPATTDEVVVEEAQAEATEETVAEEVKEDELETKLEDRVAALEDAINQLLEKLNSLNMSKRKPSAEAIKQSKVETTNENTIDAKAEMAKIKEYTAKLKG